MATLDVFIIPVMAAFAIAFVCMAIVSSKEGGFSGSIFLASASIALAILIAENALPSYMIVLSFLMLLGVLVMTRQDGVSGGQ